ncbi:MAG TPA: uroporphyrinogen decarboxylase [bacterium]|jgi:uroporphyrinogen decarboxylase
MSVAVSSQRFLQACRREPVDRTPVWFMRQAGRSQPEYRALRERYAFLDLCRQSELVAEITLRPVEQLGVDAAILFADIMLPLRGMGVAVELEEGLGPRVASPLRTDRDVQTLRAFEPDEVTTGVLRAIPMIRRACPVPLIGFAGAPFTVASYLVEGGPSRDFLQTKAMMYQVPHVWHRLMTRLGAMTVSYLRYQIEAGAQAVQLFDSWIGALSPADYATYVASHMRDVFAALPPGVPVVHFGTSTSGLLEQMAAAGGDVIGVDWRVDLGDAWTRIGPARGIQGNLDPALLLAPPDVMEHHAGVILARAAGRPGHIFNLGHGVLPETAPGQLKRLVEFVHHDSAAVPDP